MSQLQPYSLNYFDFSAAAHARTSPVAAVRGPLVYALRSTVLVLRGGGGAKHVDDEDEESDLDSEARRDKYADEPPPDFIRYSGGVAPAPAPKMDAPTETDRNTSGINATIADLQRGMCSCVCVCVCVYVHVFIHVTSYIDQPYHILRPHAVKDFVFYVLLKFYFMRKLTKGIPL
jgi:hypothetical protein